MGDHVPPPFQIPANILVDLERMGAFLDVGRDAHQLGLEMLIQVNRNFIGQPFQSNFHMVAYLLFSKAFLTFQSVRNLCLIGCGSDALGLCGSLFENLVDLAYVKQAPDSRSRRFIQFEQVDKYYQAEKILRRKRLPKGWRKRYRDYIKSLAPQVVKLLPKYPKQREGWARRNLRERAKAVKLDLEYDELYFIFCVLKHTLPAGAAGMFIENRGGVDVIRGPNIKNVYPAALESTKYLLRIADHFQDIFGLAAQRAQIILLMERLDATSNELLAQQPDLCE